VLTRAQWAWVYRHTCGQARRLLQTIEDKEQPFKPGKKLTAVELRSITKTPVPESYQVLWAETSTEASNPTVKTALWTGTFSVGRLQLPTLADALDNRLGLCVTAFDVSPQPEGPSRRGFMLLVLLHCKDRDIGVSKAVKTVVPSARLQAWSRGMR